MRVLILEDDDLVADLLETVIAGSWSGSVVHKSETLEDGLRELVDNRFDLIITDWNLPDGSGLELVRRVRSVDEKLPIVMVSARSDRDSVLKAAHYGISGYITKPFSVEMVHERLTELIGSPEPEAAPDLRGLLERSLEQLIQLPGELDPAEVLALMDRKDDLSPAVLAEQWREDPGLVTRLLDVANGSSFRRSGKPVETVRDAIGLLGVPMALNQALAMALDVGRVFTRKDLAELAEGYQKQALSVGREGQRIALTLKKSPEQFQKAGLLSRVGELAVLRVLNQFVREGGELAEGQAEASLEEWAQAYGNRLKVQWRLPLGLRDMIGAVHYLPRDDTRKDRILMRAAALLASGDQETEECQTLLRRLGLDSGDDDEA